MVGMVLGLGSSSHYQYSGRLRAKNISTFTLDQKQHQSKTGGVFIIIKFINVIIFLPSTIGEFFIDIF